jgi:hypothetical protein
MEEIFSYGWPGIKKFFRKNLVALLYTIIFHLLILIVLVLVKVEDLKKDYELGIKLEFEERTLEDFISEQELQVPAEWLEEVIRQREASSNRAVNLNAENRFSEDISTNEYLRDLLDQIEMARKQEDKERLEELQAILAAADYVPPVNETLAEEETEYSGPTTISYEFLEEPLQRRKVNLTVPVYRCQGSGLVRVAVLVARDGTVITASVLEPMEGEDRICFSDAAYSAALSSRFRIDLGAPEKQKAIITYSFIAQ